VMNCVMGLVCFAAVAAFALSPLSRSLLGEANAALAQWALLALAAHVLMTLMRGVIGAGLRSVGQYSLLVAIAGTMRLTDTLIVLAIATLGGSIFDAAIGMLIGAVVAVAATATWFQRRYPWLPLGFGHASRASVKEMLPSSLHFIGYTLGNLISIQGATIVIGAVLGPAAVALTSTARTLVRTGIAVSNMLGNTLQIEYAAMFGRSAFDKFRRLFQLHALAIAALIAAYLAAMLWLGPLVYEIWTHGEFGTPRLLISALAVGIACEMAWTALQTPSIAVNRMRITGRAFFVVSCLGLVALGLLAPTFGVIAFGWVSLAVSSVMIIAAALETRILTRSLAPQTA